MYRHNITLPTIQLPTPCLPQIPTSKIYGAVLVICKCPKTILTQYKDAIEVCSGSDGCS